MPEYKVSVQGMMCGGCQGNVEKVLREIEGVNVVNVDLENKLATIQAEGVFDLKDAVKKINDAGYEASVAK
ncbi:copper ion-binding protein [Acrasis kona]|uniref:Copper ion-binding protein n=1 Tax=Acrasis kona TaxID=1008807 RepID=A0AAW2Z8J2_9EUKA